MSSKEFFKALFNPFEDFTSRTLLIIGGSGFILMSFLSYALHFINDGIIQLHTSEPKTYWSCLINGGINTTSLSLLLFGYGKIAYRRTRVQDVLIAVLIAQLALLLIVAVTMNSLVLGVSNDILKEIQNGNIDYLRLETGNLILLSISGLFGISLLYYFFHLLVIGMKIAINSKKLVHTIVIVLLTLILNMILMICYPYL